MPKKYTKRKSYKRRGQRRGKVYGAAAGQLWKDVKMLKELINVEFKVKDTVSSAAPDINGPALALLNGLTKGDDYNNRDGRQVRWKSIQGYARPYINASATHTTIRMIIFIDKQSSETAATAASLLDVTSASAIDAFRNLSNRKRYVILKDRRVSLSQDRPETVIKFYKKLDMKQVFDDSDTGGISDIATNSIYVLFASDEATNVPQIPYNFRLRFIDN